MTAEEFAHLGEALWGRWGWQARLSEVWGCSDSTIRKYKSGRLPVPQKMAVFLRDRLARQQADADKAQAAVSLPISIRRQGTQLVIDLPPGIAPTSVGIASKPATLRIDGDQLVIDT